MPCAQFLEEREAVSAGHDDVREDQVEGLELWRVQELSWRCRRRWLVSCQTEGAGERGQGVGFVVDDEQVRFLRHSG